MTTQPRARPEALALIRHLDRFPQDLRDIRRLQRVFRLSALESARALDSWQTHDKGRKSPSKAS